MFSKFSEEEISPNIRGSRPAWVAANCRKSELNRCLSVHEVANFDVPKACDKIRSCLAYLSNEPKAAQAPTTRKMPLGMASTLCYGTLRIHQQQVNNLLRASSDLAGVINVELEATKNRVRSASSNHHNKTSFARVGGKKGRYEMQFGAVAESYAELLEEVENFREWSLQQSPQKSNTEVSVSTLIRLDRNLLKETEPFNIDRPEYGLQDLDDADDGFGNFTREELTQFLDFSGVLAEYEKTNENPDKTEKPPEIVAAIEDIDRSEKTQGNVASHVDIQDAERIEKTQENLATKRKSSYNYDVDPKIARQSKEPPILAIECSQEASNELSVVPFCHEPAADAIPTELFPAYEPNDARLANVVACQRKRKSTMKQIANKKRAKQVDLVLELSRKQQIDQLFNYSKFQCCSTVNLKKVMPADELFKRYSSNITNPTMLPRHKAMSQHKEETIDYADFLRDLLGMDSEVASTICKDWQLRPAGKTNEPCVPTETQENLDGSFKESKPDIMDMQLTPNMVQMPIDEEDKDFGMFKLAGKITPDSVLSKLLQFRLMNSGNRIDAKLFLAEQKYRFVAAATFNALLALHKQHKIVLHHSKTNYQLVEIELLLPLQGLLTPPKEEILETQDTTMDNF